MPIRSRTRLIKRNKPTIYFLQDEFTDTVAAGGLNNSVSQNGVRTVVDTNSKISTINGTLNFATGATTNDGVWYASVARNAGTVLVAQVTPSDTAGVAVVGWDSNQVGTVNDALQFAAIGNIKIVANGGASLNVGTYTAGTYTVWAVMRGTGIFWFVQGGTYTYPTLVYITAAGSAAGFPAIHSGSTVAVFTANFIHGVLSELWLPVPLASDGFGSSFGTLDNLATAETTGIGACAAALTWTHNTYSTSGGAALNTPSVGSELLTNGSFTSNTTGWTAAGGSSSIASVSGGQSGNALQITNGGANAGYAHQSIVTTAGDWLLVTVYWKQGTSTTGAITLATTSSGTDIINLGVTGTASWQLKTIAVRVTTTSTFLRLRDTSTANGQTFLFDEASIKKLTLADLFASVLVGTANPVVELDLTLADGASAGVVLNLDSAGSPANFVLIYFNRAAGGIYVDKYVAGAVTAVAGLLAATYSAGATLRVTKTGTTYWIHYNNTAIGSTTISDAGITGNFLCGIFNTDPGNSVDNFRCYPSGWGNEYVNLSNYLA